MSFPTASTTAWYITSQQWAAAVARRSNGRLKIELYPNSQLISQQDTVQALSSGLVDLSGSLQTAYLTSLVPRIELLDLPFLFKDAQAAYRVVDGPIGDTMFAELETKGITGFFWGSTGFRQMETTTKAIRVPGDMKGLRMRIVGGGVNAAMMQALGATPIVIEATEIYTALEQRTIDGIDPNLEELVTRKLSGIIRHVALTNHVFSLQALLGSKKKIDALPPDLQTILREEARAIRAAQRTLEAQRIADAVRTLKADGVAFTETDYEAFQKAVRPVYALLQSKLGPDAVQQAVKAANGP